MVLQHNVLYIRSNQIRFKGVKKHRVIVFSKSAFKKLSAKSQESKWQAKNNMAEII